MGGRSSVLARSVAGTPGNVVTILLTGRSCDEIIGLVSDICNGVGRGFRGAAGVGRGLFSGGN